MFENNKISLKDIDNFLEKYRIEFDPNSNDITTKFMT
jgi:hypothetical protein